MRNIVKTSSPEQENISEQNLAYRFKEGLGKYYSKTLGKRYG